MRLSSPTSSAASGISASPAAWRCAQWLGSSRCRRSVKSVYLLNQDYLFGQSIEKDTKRFLAQYRPDIKIVADEFIPLMQIKDFSPYITKIKASGAQSLLTGNYGPDLNLLIKAAVDSGLDIRFDTYLAHVIGAATAMGSNGEGRVTSVMDDHDNIAVEEHNAEAEEFFKKWRATHDFMFIAVPSVTSSRCWHGRSTRPAPPTR